MPGADLRPYQTLAIAKIARAWKRDRSTLFVCPTGGGKSRVFCAIAEEFSAAGNVLVLADRRNLVKQAAQNMREHTTLSVGVLMPMRRSDRAEMTAIGVMLNWRPVDVPAVVCASVQTMSQDATLRAWPSSAFSTIVIDEADLAVAPTYGKILAHFSGARVLGVTATPDRADKQPLGAVFQSVAHVVDIADLIRDGYLSRIRQRSVVIESVSLDAVPRRDEDLDVQALSKILSAERPLHEIVEPARRLAGDRPTIVFACNIPHAEALTETFNRYDRSEGRAERARVIHSQQEEDDGPLLDAFRRREFQFFVNVGKLVRGVDLPLTACVVMARPTQSRTLYAQMLGRGTRPSPMTGKRDLLVLDFVGNADKHTLVSPVEILGGKCSQETQERTRERLAEAPGGDVLSEMDAAEVDIASDPVIRERVRAKITTRIHAVSALGGAKGIDWDAVFVDGRAYGTDRDIARRLGVRPCSVREARARRGISPFWRPIDWSALPLGEESDTEIARRVGVTPEAVGAARKRRGIPAHDADKSKIDWHGKPLGEISDEALARMLGVSVGRVAGARRKRGITRLPDKKAIDWNTLPMGQETDAKIAARIGVDPSVVTRKRNALGIPAFVPANKRIDWDSQPLGQVSDCELARRIGGVHNSVVCRERQKRGIPAFVPSPKGR